MPKSSTPAAASQSLVSFTFNLPANFAALFAKVVKADGLTPQQAAAVAVTSWLRSGCDAHRLPGFDDRKAQALAVVANAAGADAEHVNVTLLAEDLDYIIENTEDLLHNDTFGTDELTGLELAEAAEKVTPAQLRKVALAARTVPCGALVKTHKEFSEDCHDLKWTAAHLRRLLAAAPTMAAAEVCK